MIRRNAAFLCVLGLMATDVLLIAAVVMRPKIPIDTAAVAVRWAPQAPVASSDSSAAPSDIAASDVLAAKQKQIGVASWYGDHWQGRVTASGKPFDDRKMTAAHRTLPLNTRVRVTNLDSGRSVEVTITDRGPYVDGRVIDLSAAAAEKLGMVKQGLAPVQITTVAPPDSGDAPDTQTKIASLDVR